LFIEVSPRTTYAPVSTTTETTTTTTTTEATTIISSAKQIDITTKSFEHTSQMMSSTESSSLVMITEESNQNYSSETFSSIPSTIMSFEESTITTEQEITSTESEFDYMTTNQADNEEETNFTSLSANLNEENSSTVPIPTYQPRLFHLLANLSQHITTEHPFIELNSG
jgi:nitrogenase subunit NifH